jgi:hypothetical protein
MAIERKLIKFNNGSKMDFFFGGGGGGGKIVLYPAFFYPLRVTKKGKKIFFPLKKALGVF